MTKYVMAEDVIEACHNGIVSWKKQSNVKPVLIQDDYVKTKERWGHPQQISEDKRD